MKSSEPATACLCCGEGAQLAAPVPLRCLPACRLITVFKPLFKALVVAIEHSDTLDILTHATMATKQVCSSSAASGAVGPAP